MDTPYYQAARYPSKTAAGKAYTPIQRFIHDQHCDVSAYRYMVPRENTWYVAVIGEKPAQYIQEQLSKFLKKGEQVTLSPDTLTMLFARRLQQIQHGDWVEGHYGSPDQE